MTPSQQKSFEESNSDWQRAVKIASRKTQPPKLTDDSFKAQAQFLQDESNLIAVLCTRRAGKSYGAALQLLRAAYKHPGASCLYIALTRDSAKRILWKDVLKSINREKRLNAVFNETTLSMTLPNGSVVYLLGADTDEEEKQKLLGQKYAAVVIDESASFSIDLNELVYGILKPAVADYRGSISLIGTPGNLKKGLYFELTQGQDPLEPGQWQTKGWSCHRWSAADNPHMAKQWAQEIAELEAANPLVRDTPIFQQHYLGRWTVDESKLVYRYLPGRNDVGELPSLHLGDAWSYVLGVDLGYEDATAFVVVAFSNFERVLYVLESTATKGLDVTATAEAIKALQKRYDFNKIVIDNANKQAVEEMKKRHGLPLHPAHKVGKSDFIEIMNGDFIQGYIKLLPECQPLKTEYAELIWNDRSEKREEHPNCDNHRADASLYAWRYAYSYLAERKPRKAPQAGSPEWHEQHAKRLAEQEASMRESALDEQLTKQQERAEQEEWGMF